MAAPDRLSQLRPIFWNPVRSGLTCTVCTAPVDGWQRCYQCGQHSRSGYPLANIVAPITYAIDDGQVMRYLYDYKNPLKQSAQQAQTMLTFALFESLSRHLRCFRNLSAAPLAVASVPSSSGRQGDHPVREMLRMFSSVPEIDVQYSGPTGLDRAARRILDPERFEVGSAQVEGAHVLLIDDTWVSGAHMQSTAAALHGAGAAWVSAVPIGRMLKKSGKDTAPFLKAIGERIFDPEVCPITGRAH